MACTLSNTGIQQGLVIFSQHVSQSVDAFTGAEAYDITISGSLEVTGSVTLSGSCNNIRIVGIPNTAQDNILAYNCNTGTLSYVCSDSFNPQPSVSPYETGSNCAIQTIDGNNSSIGYFSSIVGGCSNSVSATNFSLIGGGQINKICNGGGTTGNSNIIGNGENNRIFGCTAKGNSIVSGNCNCITGSLSSTTEGNVLNNFIGSGDKNIISGSVIRSSIVGGCSNKIVGINSGTTNPTQDNFIGGGECNIINTDCANKNFIGSGCLNTIDAGCISLSCIEINRSFIGSGFNNTASTSDSFIAGGCNNYVCHNESFIIGSNITSCAVCTTHVNNLNVGCTTQMQLRTSIGTGQAGMLVACDAGGGAAELYFHDGTSYKKVCLVP